MDAEYAFVARRSLAATLGRESWIDANVDDEWERQFYIAIDLLVDRDPKAWRAYHETVWLLARNPDARLPNTPGHRKFMDSFRKILEEVGIRLYPT